VAIHQDTRNFQFGRISHLGGWLVIFAGVGAGFWSVAVLQADPVASSEQPDRPFAQIARHDVCRHVWTLAFSPGDARLASGTFEGDLWIDDLVTGCSLRGYQGAFSSIRSLEFSPDGRVLAVGGEGPVVRLYDTGSGAKSAGLTVGRRVRTLAFSRDGSILAVGGYDGTTTLWDWVGRRRLTSLAGHQAGVNALAFSPDGRWLASGGSDGQVIVWDTARGRKQRTNESDESRTPVMALEFSPYGRLLAGAGAQVPVVRFWDAATGAPRGTFSTAGQFVNALAFSPDSALLAVALGDGTALLWDVTGARELARPGARGRELLSVAFRATGECSRLVGRTVVCASGMWRRSSVASSLANVRDRDKLR
jgi:WD40 repeat protein